MDRPALAKPLAASRACLLGDLPPELPHQECPVQRLRSWQTVRHRRKGDGRVAGLK